MSKKNPDLPKYVKIAGPSYIWRKFTPQKVIGRVDSMSITQVKAWVERELDQNKRSKTDLRSIADEYNRSPQFLKNKPNTQKDQFKYSRKIINYPLEDGEHTFGDVNYNKLTKGKIQSYLDKRFDDGVIRSANLEFAYLSAMFTWAVSRDKMKINPCIGVQKLKEKPKQEYIEDDHFWSVVEIASDKSEWYMAPMLEILYTCRLRISEVINLKLKHVEPRGLVCERGKGSKTNKIEWSTHLKAAVKVGLDHTPKIRPMDADNQYVFCQPNGDPYTVSAVQSAWSRLMRQYVITAGIERFKLHDIKRKGISDDPAANFADGSGHLSQSMGVIYDKSIKTVQPVPINRGKKDTQKMPKMTPKEIVSD